MFEVFKEFVFFELSDFFIPQNYDYKTIDKTRNRPDLTK